MQEISAIGIVRPSISGSEAINAPLGIPEEEEQAYSDDDDHHWSQSLRVMKSQAYSEDGGSLYGSPDMPFPGSHRDVDGGQGQQEEPGGSQFASERPQQGQQARPDARRGRRDRPRGDVRPGTDGRPSDGRPPSPPRVQDRPITPEVGERILSHELRCFYE